MDKQEMQALVAECRASGMTAKAWCEAKGIKYSSYVSWASKVNREEQHKPRKWADVTMVKEERDWSEIRLNCGKWTICVEPGFSPALLAEILKVVNVIC